MMAIEQTKQPREAGYVLEDMPYLTDPLRQAFYVMNLIYKELKFVADY
ncbi:hypothetical protein HanRHA438_Chr03g0147541 [Helianthus annuus]|nr:hypothetical protein HanRHA438_Chr03g0147541 [Helianthus annuus]